MPRIIKTYLILVALFIIPFLWSFASTVPELNKLNHQKYTVKNVLNTHENVLDWQGRRIMVDIIIVDLVEDSTYIYFDDKKTINKMKLLYNIENKIHKGSALQIWFEGEPMPGAGMRSSFKKINGESIFQMTTDKENLFTIDDWKREKRRKEFFWMKLAPVICIILVFVLRFLRNTPRG
jgi:hypothetical protein